MAKTQDLFTARKTLDQICTIPDKIISVYSLEQHVWAGSNSEAARKARQPELKTIQDFQLDPVRPFLTDMLRNMAAPYKREKKDNPIGQGYWVQAEFGSGKSHLLCLMAGLALGSEQAWEIVRDKEQKAGRGKRESLFRFWEEGLQTKCSTGRGIFVVVKTLVGSGGGIVGGADQGRRLSEYIVDAVKEQLQVELGKNVSLYPSELLADRFLSWDLERYKKDLGKFLNDPAFFEEDEFENVDDFIRDIQQDETPAYKVSCGNRLWRFYTEYLKVQPQIEAETEDVLRHMVEVILAEGYTGVLLVLDEVSLFMKNRSEDQRTDDEKTLVVLSNRLAKVINLPIWTICSAQQAIESRMGVKNIIADDRLKLVKLLEEDKDYYDIVLARVREIKDPAAIANYYLHYKRGFTWPNSIGEDAFSHFFPFHKPALEVVRAITYELTTTRSAIHFMHQTLKHQMKVKGSELIRLWELFDEAVQYEEDPSGVHASLTAVKTRRETEYKAYEACKQQIEASTKGFLKVHRDKAVKVVQTLFLYHIARTRQQGITPEEIANSVVIERDAEANPEENIQHYETLADNLKKELRQIVQTYGEGGGVRYRFDPVFTGVDPRDEFLKARDEAESNAVMQREAWEHLLALDEWPVRIGQVRFDLSSGVRSIFRDVAPFVGPWEDRSSARYGDQRIDTVWQGRQVLGLVVMRDLARVDKDGLPLPAVDSAESDLDFVAVIASRPVSHEVINRLLAQRKDPRLLLWTPGELTSEEHDRLLNFAAYRKLVSAWQGKDSDDAAAVIGWVADSLETDMGRIAKIVDSSYARGWVDALNNSRMEFHVAGEIPAIIRPLVDRVLSATYQSADIKFDPPLVFRKEEGVKVINGIVKMGQIPKGAKPNQDTSAAQNFGFGLKIMAKGVEKRLDISGNSYVSDMWDFIDGKLTDPHEMMKLDTLYKNFMGIGGPKDYGLTRRMVQIYLLCLVREGRVRVTVGPKSGLGVTAIDYSNIADIDFSAKVLDSLTEIQKVAKPENWDVLRPYAENLLGEAIPETQDEAAVAQSRARLRTLFAQEREEVPRVESRAKALFDVLKRGNPYENELAQVATLYSRDLETGDDINLILYGLKEAFGYQCFDANSASQAEVEDLANRLRNYRDVKRFLEFESELRTAGAYCGHILPDLRELEVVRECQSRVAAKLANVQEYIDSEVKLKAELIGRSPPDPAEHDTLGSLVRDYTEMYLILHDNVGSRADEARAEVQAMIEGDDMKALGVLENITALQPAVSEELELRLAELADGIFLCSSPSKASVQEQLRADPVHECGLTFQNASGLVDSAEDAAKTARSLLDQALDSRIQVFLNPAVGARLEQGKSEPLVAGLLGCEELEGLRAYLTQAALKDSAIVGTINRYLKRIVVRRVSMASFRPSSATVEMKQIPALAQEFQAYLERELDSVGGNGETLPMLQLE